VLPSCYLSSNWQSNQTRGIGSGWDLSPVRMLRMLRCNCKSSRVDTSIYLHHLIADVAVRPGAGENPARAEASKAKVQ